jgi:hypothetical protein
MGAPAAFYIPELWLPVPERPHDARDELARHVRCPVCFGRPGGPCWWAEPQARRSWVTHRARQNATAGLNATRG